MADTPTPTPLTDDQAEAIRARLEAIYVPTERAKQRAADFLAHAPDDIASLLADRTALTRRVEELTAERDRLFPPSRSGGVKASPARTPPPPTSP